jgi:hypothetical protein
MSENSILGSSKKDSYGIDTIDLDNTAPNVVSNIKNETREIPLDQLQEPVPENVEIDFMNQDKTDEFIKKPTKEASDLPPLDDKQKTISDLNNDINSIQNQSTNKTAKDFEDEAGLIIEVVDWLASVGLSKLAGDPSSSAYAMPVEKKKRLIYFLSLILYKRQSQLNIEVLFIMGLIAVYFPAAMKAYEGRKKINADKKRIEEMKAKLAADSKTRQKQERSAVDVPFIKVDESKPVTSESEAPLVPTEDLGVGGMGLAIVEQAKKRRPGRPSKA